MRENKRELSWFHKPPMGALMPNMGTQAPYALRSPARLQSLTLLMVNLLRSQGGRAPIPLMVSLSNHAGRVLTLHPNVAMCSGETACQS